MASGGRGPRGRGHGRAWSRGVASGQAWSAPRHSAIPCATSASPLPRGAVRPGKNDDDVPGLARAPGCEATTRRAETAPVAATPERCARLNWTTQVTPEAAGPRSGARSCHGGARRLRRPSPGAPVPRPRPVRGPSGCAQWGRWGGPRGAALPEPLNRRAAASGNPGHCPPPRGQSGQGRVAPIPVAGAMREAWIRHPP